MHITASATFRRLSVLNRLLKQRNLLVNNIENLTLSYCSANVESGKLRNKFKLKTQFLMVLIAKNKSQFNFRDNLCFLKIIVNS